MGITSVTAIYYSATGNTQKVIRAIAEAAAAKLGVSVNEIDYTLPQNRTEQVTVPADSLTFFATPVYAGRIPNKMLPVVQENFKSEGALACPIATFGNRNFDNGLIELRNELENNGFHTIAGIGVPTEHVFSDILATGRPDADDIKALGEFGEKVAEKAATVKAAMEAGEAAPEKIAVRGDDPVGPYYRPLGMDGQPAVFLKAKPLTKAELCDNCGICAKACPMGSINPENCIEVTGVCIKCQACIKKCPVQAKYMEDAAFLSHVEYLKAHFTRRAEMEMFI